MKRVLCAFLLFSLCSIEGRIQVRQTGSSTVYPFAVKVAHEFFEKTENVSPFVESTGTGKGFDDFTIKKYWYDVVNASRPIKEKEIKSCKRAGIKSIMEVCIGLDGIAVAVQKDLKGFESLTIQNLFAAIAKKVKDSKGNLIDNPYKKWKEINPELPDLPIRILIPSKVHGTRDAFENLVMSGQKIRDGEEVREISDYEAADGHGLLFDFLEHNSNVLAFMALNLLGNHKQVKALQINEVDPTFLNVQTQKYPLVRKLFIYVRKENYAVVEGLKRYVNEWLSSDAVGEHGYLTEMGLVPLPKDAQRIRIL